MIVNYLNCLLKAATSLKVSSGRQWQAAANFEVYPNSRAAILKKGFILGDTPTGGITRYHLSYFMQKNVYFRLFENQHYFDYIFFIV